ncbi:MAG: cation:proton antiporter subunit C [Pseudomonadota bacterium]
MLVDFVLERANYWAIIGLMMVGLYITFQATNLIKRLVGISIFQTSVFLFYITLGKVAGGSAPIFYGKDAKDHGGGHGNDSHGSTAQHGAPAGVADAHDDVGADHESTVVGQDIGHGSEQPAAETLPTATDAGEGVLPVGLEQTQLTGLQEVYSNPLPHVLILTAIVVGVATLSVGLAIVVRIREAYGTIERDEIRLKDIEIADAEDADDAVTVGAG